jgi:hypothetical protein
MHRILGSRGVFVVRGLVGIPGRVVLVKMQLHVLEMLVFTSSLLVEYIRSEAV